ncbi:PI31 proteasome regulator N-terminal-domain-containing protein [Infundibulicybe gibba]|nr:PI31 proteasome regulator N-terminal-domain-containing protein [Infundibulicybe gibba]
MIDNILDPSALTSTLPSLLPPSAKSLASPQDGIAALVHTAMSLVGFRLSVVGESSPNVLPQNWNQHGPEYYNFEYRHDQSSLEFVVKITKLGGRTLVNAIATDNDQIAGFDISTNDFVSPSFFPCDLSAPGVNPLIHGFISSNRIADLTSRFKLTVVHKLIPGLRKDGYTEEPTNREPSHPSSSHVSPPARPRPEPASPYRNPSFDLPPNNPLQIGRRDLDPFPSNPFNPPSLFPSSGDGMFVGPDHPIFGARSGRQPQHGPWGGDGFLPPMGAPEGARFDPVAPFGGVGGRRRPPGGGNMGGPDNDEFMPPGAVRLLNIIMGADLN